MIPYEEALAAVLDAAEPTPPERVSLTEAVGRVLAEDVMADLDHPPFNRAAVDGFACRREDLGQELILGETIRAGAIPSQPVYAGRTARIMTGAIVPDGADVVFPEEDAELLDGERVRFVGASVRANIAYKGQDVEVGDLLLSAGTRLDPRHAALLATAGATRPVVARRPRVAVLATGDELVEPTRRPALGQIRDSNTAQLEALVRAAGGQPLAPEIVGDGRMALTRTLLRVAGEADVVVLTGGATGGDFDLVSDVLRMNGVDIVFDALAMEPGRAAVFGEGDGFVCFGLPGRPDASFVVFETLVRPYIASLLGLEDEPIGPLLELTRRLRRKRTDVDEWLPVRLQNGRRVAPVDARANTRFFALTRADGLMHVPRDVETLDAGESARVLLF